MMLLSVVTACGGGGSDGGSPPPTLQPPVAPAEALSFTDIDSNLGQMAGAVEITRATDESNITEYQLFWSDSDGNLPVNQPDPFYSVPLPTSNVEQVLQVTLPNSIDIPQDLQYFTVRSANAQHVFSQGPVIKIFDYKGNALASGPGGNERTGFYEFGGDAENDKPSLVVYKSEDRCIMDNGFVMVIDMQNKKDSEFKTEPDDGLYPAFEFDCLDENRNTYKSLFYEDGTVYAQSPLNDAFFYGYSVHDFYETLLGTPPLEDKIRLRVHYGTAGTEIAFWDGVYVSLSDGMGLRGTYPKVGLDVIAHEISHGVTQRFSNIGAEGTPLQAAAISEAFSDMAGEAAEYVIGGSNDFLVQAELQFCDIPGSCTTGGALRYFEHPSNDGQSIESVLDVDEVTSVYYKMGVYNRAFFVLANTPNWNTLKAFEPFLWANRFCWTQTTEFLEGAKCVLQGTEALGYDRLAAIEAFRDVDITLFDEGTFAYFLHERAFRTVNFQDHSASDNTIVRWQWDFGDDQSSEEQSPQHTYADNGTYHVELKVIDNEGRENSDSALITVTDQYCPAESHTINDHWISAVSINNNEIESDSSAYSDFTHQLIMLPPNTALTFELSPAPSPAEGYWKAWVDINLNGQFDADELVAETSRIEGKYTFQWTPPAQLAGKSTRLRIFHNWALIDGPCTDISAGEVEDYQLSLQGT